jgi:hypothetical protein
MRLPDGLEFEADDDGVVRFVMHRPRSDRAAVEEWARSKSGLGTVEVLDESDTKPVVEAAAAILREHAGEDGLLPAGTHAVTLKQAAKLVFVRCFAFTQVRAAL